MIGTLTLTGALSGVTNEIILGSIFIFNGCFFIIKSAD
jgi:hypothetical protein